MPSDIDIVVTQSKALEALLEQKFGATGRGLHEKLTSIDSQLEISLVKNLRWIATMRNKVVHEDFELTSQDDFIKSCQRALEGLNTTPKKLKVIDKSVIDQSLPRNTKFHDKNNRVVRKSTATSNRHYKNYRHVTKARKNKQSSSGLLFIIFIVVAAIIWSFLSK